MADDSKYTALAETISELTDLTKITAVHASSGEIEVVGAGGAAKTIGGPRQLVAEAVIGQDRLAGAMQRAWQNIFVWRGTVKEGNLNEIRLDFYNATRAT